MKTDFYTKTVLTVIAASLLLITMNLLNLFPQAMASESSSSVGLSGIGKESKEEIVQSVYIKGIDPSVLVHVDLARIDGKEIPVSGYPETPFLLVKDISQ